MAERFCGSMPHAPHEYTTPAGYDWVAFQLIWPQTFTCPGHPPCNPIVADIVDNRSGQILGYRYADGTSYMLDTPGLVTEERVLRDQLANAESKLEQMRDGYAYKVQDLARETLRSSRLHEQLESILGVTATPFKGPHDTDASVLRDAAGRVDHGYVAGGSNTSATVSRVLRAVAAVLEESQ